MVNEGLDKDIKYLSKEYEDDQLAFSANQINDWEEIEELVIEYQKQFNTDCLEQKYKSQEAASILFVKFEPLIRKYTSLIKTGQIDFRDEETKKFVSTFIDDIQLRRELKKDRKKTQCLCKITHKFYFVKETYGELSFEEIDTDIKMLLLALMKRYKQVGKNFCAYVYNVFCYEISRHIKKYISNPANIHYKKNEYEDYMQTYKEDSIEMCFEDKIYENNVGIPDMSWISGLTCSDAFTHLSNLERKLLIKYYLEKYNDKQISEEFGLHINTVNLKRRNAVYKLCQHLGVDYKSKKRSRNSGRNKLSFDDI